MAKRSDSNDVSEQRVKARPVLERSTVRKLQLRYPAIVKYKGTVTGKLYEWSGAGAVLEVDSRDADELLMKYFNNSRCCGSVNKPQPKFVEV